VLCTVEQAAAHESAQTAVLSSTVSTAGAVPELQLVTNTNMAIAITQIVVFIGYLFLFLLTSYIILNRS
jgi:hypothetical protein